MKSIFLWVIFGCVLIAQPRSKSFLWEVNSFPKDSGYAVYLSYKISYDLLVFVKNNDKYSAGVKCFAEIYKDDEIVSRSSVESEVSTNNYDLTNSSEKYLQGLVKFILTSGKYKIIPEFDFMNTDRISRIPGTEITLSREDSIQIFNPICVKSNTEIKTDFQLVNSGGVVPFSPESYSILLPVNENVGNAVSVSLKDNDSTYMTLQGSLVFTGTPIIAASSDVLRLSGEKSSSDSMYYFLLDSFTQKLPEGRYSILVTNNEDTLKNSINVKWVNKPRSLYDPEFAIEILRYIEKDQVIQQMLQKDEEDYYKVLKEYWVKYDRNKKTAFNEVMEEYYSRVDTSDAEFSITGDERGAETDRGRIYIKYGRPDKIERSYVENNNVAELWIYNKINRKFLFKDTSGLGNYTLMN